MRAHLLLSSALRSALLLLCPVAGGACDATHDVQLGLAKSAFVSNVGDPLNGLMMVGPCQQAVQASVCVTRPAGTCPPANPGDPALSGALLTDQTMLLGGIGGNPYNITLHIQGEVEAKQFTGGTDADHSASSPHADGLRTGGTPSADSYNSFLLRITGYEGGATTDYFLNSLVGPGSSQHTTYGIDYSFQIQVEGMSVVRLVLSDPNCNEIRNCGPFPNNGSVCAQPLVIANIEPTARTFNPGFNFDAPYNGQWLVMTLTDVMAL